MRRHVLGILALILLGLGGYFYYFPRPGGTQQFIHASCIRLGMILLAIWLAYPEIRRIPRWMYRVLLLAAGVVIVQPKAIVIILPALLIIWLLRPRSPDGNR